MLILFLRKAKIILDYQLNFSVCAFQARFKIPSSLNENY